MHEDISVILFLVVLVNQKDKNNETMIMLPETWTPVSGLSVGI